MSIVTNQVTGGFAGGNVTQSAKSTLSDMNSFLLMFTTQLKYQDPSNPLESYELASQLAQFSTVEKLTQLNENVKLQQTQLASINSAQREDMIGKEVVGSDNKIHLADGQCSKASYQLGSAAQQVKVVVRDAAGQAVRTMDLGSLQAGRYDLQWDGRNDAGEMMRNGSYQFSVEAVDANGNVVDASTSVSGKVYAFRMVEGVPYLVLDSQDGVTLAIGSVTEVHQEAKESILSLENPIISLS